MNNCGNEVYNPKPYRPYIIISIISLIYLVGLIIIYIVDTKTPMSPPNTDLIQTVAPNAEKEEKNVK